MTERTLRRTELLVTAVVFVVCVGLSFALPDSQRLWVYVGLGSAVVIQGLVFAFLRRRTRGQGTHSTPGQPIKG